MNKLSNVVYSRNIEKGFYDKEKNVGEMLALMHSEISEALECDRKGKYFNGVIEVINGVPNDEDFRRAFEQDVKDTFEDEMADIIIRVLDMCGFKGIDIESHIEGKMRYNALRPHKHGKKY